ncbi:hypothetical protein [Aestuariivivens marinum]|uniref:hypothetical protein n=1 Tax=Aestuariivivens marinum TaxID=2913555 RepID=UPI001F5A7935|nr:hypothetical protein [Aestuariivivens marinum]
MKNWNKIGKIKSLVILILCVLSLILVDFNGKAESKNDFYIGIIILTFLFIVLFLPLITKFWSLLGFKFEKPNWNENPITFKFSKSLNFFQFMAFWFISSGFINVLLIGIFSQKFDGESAHLFFAGISLLIGIKLSLKWLNKSRNGKEKTVANNV